MAKVIQLHVVEAAGAKGVAGAKIMVAGSATEQVTNQDGVVQLEVTKIEQKRLADALFTIPGNYTKMDMSKMDMPRRP